MIAVCLLLVWINRFRLLRPKKNKKCHVILSTIGIHPKVKVMYRVVETYIYILIAYLSKQLFVVAFIALTMDVALSESFALLLTSILTPHANI